MNRLCHPSTRHHSAAKDGRVPSSNRSPFRCCGYLVRSFFLPLISLAVVLSLQADASAQGKAGNQSKIQKKDKPAQPVGDLEIDPVTLPKTFQPPSKPLAIMNLEMPIASDKELEKLRKEWQKFSKVKTDCDLSPAGQKVIADSIRYRLASMTAIPVSVMRDNPNKLPQLRQEFLREISTIGSSARRPKDIADTAKFVYGEVRKQIPELLKNNFYVRLNAVLILNEIDYKLAYVPTYELLLQVIQAKDIRDDENNGQPEAIKIDAVKGLTRILRFAPDCLVRDKAAIANAMVEELGKKEPHWWRQERMIEVLRYCGISGIDPNNKPFVVECLMSIIKDKDRDWRVRAKACYALGRVPLPAAIKPEDIVYCIAEFALQLSRETAAQPNNPIWKGCFWELYLAFRPNSRPRDPDQDAEEKREGGLLAASKSAAQPAYEVIVPIVNDVLVNGKSPDAGNVKKLSDFVNARGNIVRNAQ